MIDSAAISLAGKNPADRLSAIAAAIVMAVVGITVFMGAPVIVGSLSEGYRLTDSQAGYLASMDFVGAALASLVVSVLVIRFNRRYLLLVGLLAGGVFNLLTSLVQDYPVLIAIRLFAGFGGGIVYAVGIALLAGTGNAGRNFSILMFAQVGIGALELYSLPKLAAGFGTQGIFVAVAALFFLVLPLLRFVQKTVPQSRGTAALSVGKLSTTLTPWLGLGGVFFFYVAVGSFWAYIERLGSRNGLDAGLISDYLSLGNLLSMVGCGLAYWLSTRVGYRSPLLFALLLLSFACLTLSGVVTQWVYMSAVFAFFLLWNLVDIFQLSVLSDFDGAGGFAALAPAFQSVGVALGPAKAAWLLDNGQGLNQVMLLNAGSVAIAFCCFCAVFCRNGRLVSATGFSGVMGIGQGFKHNEGRQNDWAK